MEVVKAFLYSNGNDLVEKEDSEKRIYKPSRRLYVTGRKRKGEHRMGTLGYLVVGRYKRQFNIFLPSKHIRKADKLKVRSWKKEEQRS